MTAPATLPPAVEVDGPGIYELTDEQYFNGPLARTSLSSTGARDLLDCPAKFRHNQLNARKDTKAFDMGHAAHKLVLGAGPELVSFPGTGKNPEAWQKADDIADVAALRAEGKVPLKPSDYATVHAMAAALKGHRIAPKLFTHGAPEQSMVWRDEATGVLCRAKADWLTRDGIVDYKTARTVRPASLPKAVHEHGYFVQAAFYLRGFRATDQTGLNRAPFFVFVAQEKEPPYLVTVFQLADEALAYGDRLCAEALERYRDCLAADEWPGYSDDIEDIALPAWVRTEEW
jgi:PDDEXK-like uncharacterized protein DUF3799